MRVPRPDPPARPQPGPQPLIRPTAPDITRRQLPAHVAPHSPSVRAPTPRPSADLLRSGERVRVSLRAPDTVHGTSLVGAVVGTDAHGLALTLEEGREVFIPWTSISTITKLAG